MSEPPRNGGPGNGGGGGGRGRGRRRGGRGRRRTGTTGEWSTGGGRGNGPATGEFAAAVQTPRETPAGPRIDAEGVLEVNDRGGGFLRARIASYLPSSNDTFVPQGLIQRLKLRPGDEIKGEAIPPRAGKGPLLETVTTVFGREPSVLEGRVDFARLPAIHPSQSLRVAPREGIKRGGDITPALVDLLCPLGKGQRCLVVAPAKAGKTMLLTAIARGITANYPETTVYILLADERPEEVTEMELANVGEVIASSFDHGAERHVAVAEMTLERARRRVELGEDVVIILDSLTRLARAYNNIDRGSGRTLSGGIGAEAMERPKRFFGSARAVDPKFVPAR